MIIKPIKITPTMQLLSSAASVASQYIIKHHGKHLGIFLINFIQPIHIKLWCNPESWDRNINKENQKKILLVKVS